MTPHQFLHCQTEAYRVATAALVVHEAVGGAAESGRAVVGSSTDDVEVAGRLAGRGLAVPVLTPLPDVAGHVVEAQFVGLQLCDRIVYVLLDAGERVGHFVNVVAASIEVAFRLPASTGGIFPFCLCGQTEMLAR